MPKSEKDVMKEIETALRGKIDEIENIADTGERLLQYMALKKACEGAYDREKAAQGKASEKNKYIQDGEDLAGSVGGLAGLAAGAALIAGTGVVTLGLGSLFMTGLLVLGGATVGGQWGEALGKFRFKRRNPDKVPHATKMYDMNCEIDRAIESLSSPNLQNVEALSQSPHFDEIKAKFPAISEVFNEQAALKAGREKLLKATGPVPKKSGPVL